MGNKLTTIKTTTNININNKLLEAAKKDFDNFYLAIKNPH